MPPVVAAIATFATTTFTIVGIAVTGAFLIKAAIVTAAMAFTYFSAVGAMSLGDSISGRQEMIRQPISPRRKIYGSVRVSGPLGYIGTTGTKNKFLYLTPLLASHLLTSIGNVYLNDEELTASKYSAVAQVEKTNLGTDGQAASTLLQQVPEWTSNHKLSGIAHLPAKLTFDQEKYSGIPTIKADVQGAKIYDPRKDSTNGGSGTHRLATPSTWEYSTNPILCIADYYGDDIVGMNLDTANVIHWPTVITQANICDEVVTKAGGSGTENRYTLNGTVLSNQNPGDVLPDMLTSCSGTIVNNLEGLIYIYAGAWNVPTVTLTEDDLVGDLQIIDKTSRANLFNYITGTFYNGTTHQPDEFPAVTDATFVTEDDEDELRASIELPYTNGSSESQRIANNELMRNRDQTVVMFPANIEALDLIAYDTVFLTLDFYGYTNETLRIIDYTLDIPNGTVMLTLKQESSVSWTWTAGDFTVPAANVASTFPDPYTVNAPSFNSFANSARIVQDGTVQSSVDLPFAQSDDSSIIQYEVEYKRAIDADWIPVARVPSPVDVTDTSILQTRIEGLEPDIDYDFRVRGRNYAGNFSNYDETLSHTTSGDVTPPSVPTGLTVTPSISALDLNWVNPSEEDFNAIKVYRRINSTSPSESDLLTTLSGDRSKISRYIDVVAATTTYYYWIRSVDRTGNESALTSFVNGAATSIATEGADYTTNVSNLPDSGSGIVQDPNFKKQVLLNTLGGDFWSSNYASVTYDEIANLVGCPSAPGRLYAVQFDLDGAYSHTREFQQGTDKYIPANQNDSIRVNATVTHDGNLATTGTIDGLLIYVSEHKEDGTGVASGSYVATSANIIADTWTDVKLDYVCSHASCAKVLVRLYTPAANGGVGFWWCNYLQYYFNAHGTWLRENNDYQLDRSSVDELEQTLNKYSDVRQGSGVLRKLPRGMLTANVRDGDVVTFDDAFLTTPEIFFIPTGLSFNPVDLDVLKDHSMAFNASGLTTSGFTASLKIQELATTITAKTDSPFSSGATYDQELSKSVAAEAWDDQYTYQYDVTVDGGGSVDEPLFARGSVEIYSNNGGGWVLKDTKNYSFWSTGSSNTWLNEVATYTIDGLGSGSTFALEYVNISSSGSVSGDNVKYETATAPLIKTATKSGVPSVKMVAIENTDTGITVT